MAKLYLYDPQINGMVSAYRNGVHLSTKSFNFRMSERPDLVGLLPSLVVDVSSFNGGQNIGRNCYVSNSNELKFNQPDIIELFELPRLEISNPKYKTRVRRGEIVMSDYRRGTVTCKANQRLVRGPITLGGQSWDKWYDIARIIPQWEAAVKASVKGMFFPAESDVRFPNLKAVHNWRTETATGLRYESIALSYPKTYPDRQDATGVVTSALAEALSTQMDVLTEIAEMPQTLAFVNQKCVQAVNLAVRNDRKKRKVIKRAKKLKWPTPKLIDRLASMELQLRYAVMPIVYSIQAAGSLLQEYGYLFKEAREAEHFPIKFSDEYGEWEGNDKVSCLVKQRFDPDRVASRVHALIGPNPVVTLWELTTLSFVVDWVVPIGDYLTALTTPSFSEELKSSLAFRCSRYSKTSTPSGLQREIFVETYEREVINPRDHIGLRVRPSMNWKRWLDASALSWSAARSKLKTVKGVRI